METLPRSGRAPHGRLPPSLGRRSRRFSCSFAPRPPPPVLLLPKTSASRSEQQALNINMVSFSGSRKKNVPLPLQPVRKRFAVCCYVETQTLLDTVKWDSKGLAVAIAQNVDTGAILMQGFANKEALEKTISTRKATFFSRSRSSLWTKGETSMNFINVHDIFLDCDRDSIIYLGKPDGPTCHTGAETCYFTSVYDALQGSETTQERLVTTTLYSLEDTISRRQEEISTEGSSKPSWTKKLLLDNQLLCSKIREEADELIQTLLENEDKSRTASEMADLLYHAMVLLRVKDVKMEEVFEILRKRFSQSGIEEKSRRKTS